MKPAPINLLHYFATDLAVKANLAFDTSKEVEAKLEEFSAEPKIKRSENGEIPVWQIDLNVKHQAGPGRNFPYEFRIHLVGLFEYKGKTLPPDDEERTVRVHGASILYGITREIIRANTARGPWDGIMLPTISFFEGKPQDQATNPESKAKGGA